MMSDLKWSNYDFTQIPFDDIVQVGQRTLLYRDIFTVSWLLGRFCNYRCSYCWPYARSDRKDHRPTELCLKTIDEIKRQARANGFNSFHFSLSGGEPTFHPGYLDILKYLADDVSNTNYTSIHMTSNCSRYNALFFHEQGINVTLKPQSDPTASRVVEGYTDDMLNRLHNGMPQRAYTEIKRKWNSRPMATFQIPLGINEKMDASVPSHFQIEFKDSKGKTWYMDQAERFNAFNFNKFKGWNCNAGYQGIIIREPDGSIKRSYSCSDAPLGNIETGFKLFNSQMPCVTESCVSSADSKIPKRKSS